MARKEDLRIIKTKSALISTFFDMLKEMSLEDITVNDLCERAGIRRATFYKHFSDKNDFTAFLIKDIRIKFEAEIWKDQDTTTFNKDYYLEYAKAIIKYLVGKEEAIKRILSSPIRHTFINVFVQLNYEDTKRRLEVSVRDGMQLVCSVDVMAGMIVSGTARCIVNWFEDENKCPADILLYNISRFLDKVLT